MPEEELLHGVRGLVECVPVDDVPARHADDLEAGAQLEIVLLQLLLPHEAEL